MAATDELVSNDIVFHSGTGGDIIGLKAMKEYIEDVYSAFPDFHMPIDDMVAEGDKVVVRYTGIGTNKGKGMGITSPTNKEMRMWVIEIDRFARGKIVEVWERLDTLGFMQQVGLIPQPK